MEEGDKGTVCVTGGTGFVGSWLIKKLVESGYSVHTTIRPDPEHKRDVSFLTSLPGASEKLQIFEADLNDPNSFDAAIKGCTGVFHVATPVDYENKEPVEVVTNRTIDGALGILKACLNSNTVKRVVYTSSTAAVLFSNTGADIVDESFWSDEDFLKAFIPGSYIISKTLAEKGALQFAEENGLDLVTLLPSFIVGPFICPQFPASVQTSMALVRGQREQYTLLVNMPVVHIDDVVSAHIFLFEHPDAKGRYICSSDTTTIEWMSEYLSKKYPEFPIPTLESLKDIKGMKMPGLSSKKLLDSGFTYKYCFEEMFDGAIQCCKEKGYL